MDFGILGTINLDWEFFTGLISIIIINIVLSGDNAVVIAMAVRSLPRPQRQKGIWIGAAGAVILRIILTFFVAQFLQTPYLKLTGGVIIIWLAVKLFLDTNPENDSEKEASTIWQALRIIVIADITMSLDNMLGVGAASKGNLFLLIFGLTTSIPIMIFTSNLLSMLMDKYPVIITVGAALLGKVGGEMIVTDPGIEQFMPHGEMFIYLIEGFSAVGVVAVGKVLTWILSLKRDR